MKVLMIEGGFLPQYFEKVESRRKAQPPYSDYSEYWTRFEKIKCDDLEDCDQPIFSEPNVELGIAVYEVKGGIIKEWSDGTLALMSKVEENEANPNCVAHLFEFDSGGGEATNCDTTARFIRSLKKPTMALVNGLACSAAYYMAAGCKKIYATQNTDIFGSIGCMISFADFSKHYEKLGITTHEVYADQSTDKNADFAAALKGKYAAIKDNLLNPYAQDFINTVNELRPNITDDGHVFAGKTYMTNDAIQLGLIDGKMTYEMALSELSKEGIKFFNKNNKTNMVTMNHSFPGIAAAVGLDGAIFASVDGNISLPVNLAIALEAKLSASTAAPAPVAEEKPLEIAETDVYKALAFELKTVKEEFAQMKAGAVVPAIRADKGDLTDVPPVVDEKAALIAQWAEQF